MYFWTNFVLCTITPKERWKGSCLVSARVNEEWRSGGVGWGNMPQTNPNRICVDAKYSSATRGSGSVGCSGNDSGGGDGWEHEASTTTTTRVEPEKWSDRKRMLLPAPCRDRMINVYLRNR